jgi:hypothetical protein
LGDPEILYTMSGKPAEGHKPTWVQPWLASRISSSFAGPTQRLDIARLFLTTENMVNYVIKIIKPVLRGEAEYAEVKKAALAKWQDGI